MLRALQVFRAGGFVMVMDSEERENECDLVIAAEGCTTEQMAFMIKHSTGIVCVVAEEQLLRRMELHPATGSNTDRNGTNFFVSTDYLVNTTTGVSAADRVATIKAMSEENIDPKNFSKPGHMFPLAPRLGGVLERQGHTESAYDLCKLAGIKRVSAIGELMHEDGNMYRLADSKEFAKKFDIPLITVGDIINARKDEENVMRTLQSMEKLDPWVLVSGGEANCCNSGKNPVERYPSPISKPASKSTSECSVRLKGIEAETSLKIYRHEEGEIVLVVKGDVDGMTAVPTRVHSECFTGDTLGSLRCDCGPQLEKFKGIMNASKCAILIYHRGHEGRGIGLWNKVAAYRLQTDENLDTIDANLRLGFGADIRSFSGTLQILNDLRVKSVKMYTNNPKKIQSFSSIIHSVEPLTTEPCEDNIDYLNTKVKRMGHTTELSTFTVPALPSMNQVRIAIVFSMWNEYYVTPIVDEIKKELSVKGVTFFGVPVPGALDLVAGARRCIKAGKADAVIAVGVLLKGNSDQYDYTCSAILANLSHLNATMDVPVSPCVQTCQNEESAYKSCFDRNPGAKVAESAVYMASLFSASDKDQGSPLKEHTTLP